MGSIIGSRQFLSGVGKMLPGASKKNFPYIGDSGLRIPSIHSAAVRFDPMTDPRNFQ